MPMSMRIGSPQCDPWGLHKLQCRANHFLCILAVLSKLLHLFQSAMPLLLLLTDHYIPMLNVPRYICTVFFSFFSTIVRFFNQNEYLKSECVFNQRNAKTKIFNTIFFIAKLQCFFLTKMIKKFVVTLRYKFFSGHFVIERERMGNTIYEIYTICLFFYVRIRCTNAKLRSPKTNKKSKH